MPGGGSGSGPSGRTRRMDFTSGSGRNQQVVDGKRISQNRNMRPVYQWGKLGYPPRSRRNFFSQSLSSSATTFSMILICGCASWCNVPPPVRRLFDIPACHGFNPLTTLNISLAKFLPIMKHQRGWECLPRHKSFEDHLGVSAEHAPADQPAAGQTETGRHMPANQASMQAGEAQLF